MNEQHSDQSIVGASDQEAPESLVGTFLSENLGTTQLLAALPRLAQIGALVVSTGAFLLTGDDIWSGSRGQGCGK